MTDHAEDRTVPLVDLSGQISGLRPELLRAFERVLDRGVFVLGEEVRRFEEAFASYCGSRHAVGCASGTDAIQLALRGLGVGPGDEVIVPAMTFIATAVAVSLVGAHPVLVDVDPATALMDPGAAGAAITPRTRALLPVHLYGQCAPMAALSEMAREHGLHLVEDAAQAHGAVQDGRRAGSLADIGCFSFYPSKNLGALGDGGAVTTGNAALGERVRILGNWGARDKYLHEELGINSRLDALQAAFLEVKLRHLDEWNEARRRHAARYDEALRDLPGVVPIRSASGSVHHLYVVRVPERDRVRAGLQAAGVAAGMHYPLAIHEQAAYRSLGHEPGAFPVAERWARDGLSLPIYPDLPDDVPVRVAQALDRLL